MIVYLARDIPQFVMYCVNGKPRSSLFIESTDSMIIYTAARISPVHVVYANVPVHARACWRIIIILKIIIIFLKMLALYIARLKINTVTLI